VSQRKLSYNIVNDTQNKAGNVIKRGRANGKQGVTPSPPTHPGKRGRVSEFKALQFKIA
jgi:hypothetical protein